MIFSGVPLKPVEIMSNFTTTPKLEALLHDALGGNGPDQYHTILELACKRLKLLPGTDTSVPALIRDAIEGELHPLLQLNFISVERLAYVLEAIYADEYPAFYYQLYTKDEDIAGRSLMMRVAKRRRFIAILTQRLGYKTRVTKRNDSRGGTHTTVILKDTDKWDQLTDNEVSIQAESEWINAYKAFTPGTHPAVPKDWSIAKKLSFI